MSSTASQEAPQKERPIAAFVLSLIAGILILLGSGTVMMAGFPNGGVSNYYGGMMDGYYGGMMGGYYGMMHGFGFSGGWFYGLAIVGIVSALVIILGAIMIYNQPSGKATWGALILAFSIVCFLGMGGFFLGAILGVIGGILALTWRG